MRQWRRAAALAGRDCLDEWHVSCCLMLALAAVIAPLLVLFGLKSGIVTTMTERLRADPRNLEVVIRGNHRLPPSWVSELQVRPDVAFIVPRTRSLAATVDLVTEERRSVAAIDMIATAHGDPLLPSTIVAPDGFSEVILSHTLAQKLHIAAGDHVEGVIRRRLNGLDQVVTLPFQIKAILPETAFPRDGIFVPVVLLVATEDFRDGFRAPEIGVEDGADASKGPRLFAGVRLYARSLNDVANLASHLRGQGFDISTKAKDIENVRATDKALTFIFSVIASVGVTGVVCALAASIWSNVDRKKKEIALLRLFGMRFSAVVAFPASQGLIIAIGGLLCSSLIYIPAAVFLNANLANNLGDKGVVCQLVFRDGLIAGLLTVFFALVASGAGAYRATRIDPAENLREL